MDKAKILARSELFKTLPPAALAAVAAKCEAVRFKEAEPLAVEGRAGDALYVIAEGHVDYVKRMDEKSGLVLLRWGPGDVVGLNPVMEGGAHHVSALAVTPVKCLRLAADDLRALRAADPSLEHRVLAQTLLIQSGRLRQITVRLREFLAKIIK